MATITSMSYLFRSAGGVIGISATTAIFQATVKRLLTERITGPDAEKVNINNGWGICLGALDRVRGEKRL